MKDPLLAKLINDQIPKINAAVAEGLAVKHGKMAIDYVDKRWRALSSGFPAGLIYLGPRKATHLEEFVYLTKSTTKTNLKTTNKPVYEVARSDIFMVVFQFTYKGESIECPLFLPHINDDSTMYLSGTCYLVSPVLNDKVITIDPRSVFVHLERTKLNFSRQPHSYGVEREVNGQYCNRREDIQVTWGKVHHLSSRSTNDHTCLVHYLFGKYGVRETFRLFCGFVPEIGNDEMITVEAYPVDKWVICSPVVQSKRGGMLHDSIVKFAIPKEYYTTLVQSFVAGFYYVTDRYPGRVLYNYVDETALWLRLLGVLIYGSESGEGMLYNKMTSHIDSLDEYIDNIMIDKFQKSGHDITDVWQLFVLLIDKINTWLVTDTEESITMYNKELSVLKYLLSPALAAINNFYFALKNQDVDKLETMTILSLMKNKIRPRACIFNVPKLLNILSTINYPGDCKPFKSTCKIVPQNETTKGRSHSGGGDDATPSRRMHFSVMEVGMHIYTPKSNPTGRGLINQFVLTDADGVIQQNPKFDKLRIEVGDLIRR
jgi:hypothetical protein